MNLKKKYIDYTEMPTRAVTYIYIYIYCLPV